MLTMLCRLATVGAVVGAVVLTGCTSAKTDTAGLTTAGPTPATSAAATSADSTLPTGSTSSAGVPSSARVPASAAPSSTAAVGSASTTQQPSPSGSTILVPPNLCAATDIAQNTADAYLGALGAGQEKQALACVLPGTVPAAVTHSLVVTERGTAVYLPRAGVDGPAVFGYQGDGKSIDVTVTRTHGTFWITKVTIRPTA